MPKTNKNYRDRLFIALFGSPERKDLTLALYNALNGSNHTDPNEIELNTLEDVIYINMKNDVSFILQGDLNMYEQQSTYNPNMPLRQFLYAAHAIEAYLEPEELRKRLYGTRLVKIPTPRLVTLYNGNREVKDGIHRLSESFLIPGGGDIEATVHVYNINSGRELPNRCKPLGEYAQFVDTCRGNGHKISVETVNAAINQLPDGPVKRYLRSQRAEVIDMILTECNLNDVIDVAREEGMEDGRAEGLKQGLEQGKAAGKLGMLLSLVKSGDLPIHTAAQKAGLTESEFKEKLSETQE